MNKPTDSVRIVLYARSNSERFLILCEADDPDNWKLPGGKIDSVDESAAAAAYRELGEELGLGDSAIQLTACGNLLNNDGVSARHIFTAEIEEDAVSPSQEIAAIKWIVVNEIPAGPNQGHILSAVAQASDAR